MLVSLKWLKDLVEVPVSLPELVDKLDLTGTAVESVKSAGEALDKVFVGQIIAKDKHPEADTLWVTKVDVGAEEPLQIVCGAQNFNTGDKVPVATVGATLPNGMTIKKAKLRGIESRGMNCSARELGLGDDHEGLMILPADAPVGMPFAEYAGLSDSILELEVTPNRPDCLSVAGFAREVGALYERTAAMPASTPAETGAPVAESVVVTIDDPDMCPRYTARLPSVVTGTRGCEWCAFDLECRRHHQLRDVRTRPAAARVRCEPAGQGRDRQGRHQRAHRSRRREADDPRWPGAHADRRHTAHHRPHRSGRSRRRDGRRVHRGG